MTASSALQPHGVAWAINLALLLAILIFATWCDIRTRRIPNRVVVSGLIGSFLLQLFGYGIDGLQAWGTGALVGFALLFPMYLVRAMGAGDVKLMALVGSFLGPTSASAVVLATLVSGGLLAVLVAMWNGTLVHTLRNVRFVVVQTVLVSAVDKRIRVQAPPASSGHLPYAVAITAGTVAHLLLALSGSWISS